MTEISISLSGVAGVDWVAHLRAYADVGLDELMLHWSVSGDIEGLGLLAEYVLPHFVGGMGDWVG